MAESPVNAALSGVAEALAEVRAMKDQLAALERELDLADDRFERLKGDNVRLLRENLRLSAEVERRTHPLSDGAGI